MARKIIIGLIFVVALAVIALPVLNPLRRSDAGVEKWVAKQTPLGCSKVEVEAVARKRGWSFHSGPGGYDGPWNLPGPYIRGELGEYQGLPFVTSVTAFWEFDTKDRLTNIRIWRTRDAP